MHLASGSAISGYHMHMGLTTGPDTLRPFATVGNNTEGATSKDGQVAVSYMHGIFDKAAVRASILKGVSSEESHTALVESTLDSLAAHLDHHLDLAHLLSLAGPA